MNHPPLRQQGITLIEVIVAVGIVAVAIVAIGFSVNAFVEARTALLHNTKALYLVEEGYEILRALRDDDWNTLDALSLDSPHYFDVSTTTLAVSGTPEVIDGIYYRSFEFTAVYRDGNDDVTASTTPGATVDNDIREVEISVFGPNGTSSLTALISNLYAI